MTYSKPELVVLESAAVAIATADSNHPNKDGNQNDAPINMKLTAGAYEADE